MGKILEINEIADKHAKEIAYRVQARRKKGDSRPFAEILQEEVNKVKKEATKDTDQSSPR